MQKQELQQWIKDNLLDKNGNVSTTKISQKRNFYKANVKYFDNIIKITSFLPINTHINERLYCISNNIQKVQLCSCGNKVTFKNFKNGYRDYCSTKCSMNDSKVHDKIIISRINNKTNKNLNNKDYYNYIYLDPRKPGRFEYPNLNFCLLYEPFYVGKGKNKRYLDHIADAKRNKTDNPKENKIRKIISLGYKQEDYIIRLKNQNENNAYKLERLLCRQIGLISDNTGPLVNESYGGLGGLGRIMSEEEKISRSTNHYMKGRNYEDIYGKEEAIKIKQKKSKSLKGHKCYKNSERNKKLSETHKGRLNIRCIKTNTTKLITLDEFYINKFYLIPGHLQLIKVELNKEILYFRRIPDLLKKYNISGSLYRNIIKNNGRLKITKNTQRLELINIKIEVIKNNLEQIITKNIEVVI